jgi:hypothetical protein
MLTDLRFMQSCGTIVAADLLVVGHAFGTGKGVHHAKED